MRGRKKYILMEDIPETSYEDPYFVSEWKTLLSSLNEKYRIVMELYYVDGFSTKEIAFMLRITESNVRSRMNRGRKQLEQYYKAKRMD